MIYLSSQLPDSEFIADFFEIISNIMHLPLSLMSDQDI